MTGGPDPGSGAGAGSGRDRPGRDGQGRDAHGVDAPGAGPGYRGSGLGFRARLTLGLIAAAVIPVAGFGLVVLLLAGLEPETDDAVARGLLIAIVISVVFGGGARGAPGGESRRLAAGAHAVHGAGLGG